MEGSLLFRGTESCWMSLCSFGIPLHWTVALENSSPLTQKLMLLLQALMVPHLKAAWKKVLRSLVGWQKE
ncbi:Hypothetical predicted protein [Podarcis lilfordi]|uniref:Uncharacterized protein n=1 Tax=Podarcis lilfordi TaxID=74358 RepID=A0AA35PP28_9SAUR|nr:Hypothetical predicted protein [Podarcis lilfordi]